MMKGNGGFVCGESGRRGGEMAEEGGGYEEEGGDGRNPHGMIVELSGSSLIFQWMNLRNTFSQAVE